MAMPLKLFRVKCQRAMCHLTRQQRTVEDEVPSEARGAHGAERMQHVVQLAVRVAEHGHCRAVAGGLHLQTSQPLRSSTALVLHAHCQTRWSVHVAGNSTYESVKQT